MAFKDMLKYLRTSHKVSQAELAKAIGVKPSTIGMYETGAREPDFETEEKIADYFNVSLDILRGKDSQSSIQFPTKQEMLKELIFPDGQIKAVVDELKTLPENKFQQLLSYIKFLKQEG